MNTERLVNIILSELSLDNLKEQETLEKTINSDLNINDKIKNVKEQLEKLVISEMMITKFQSLISDTNNNKLNQ